MQRVRVNPVIRIPGLNQCLNCSRVTAIYFVVYVKLLQTVKIQIRPNKLFVGPDLDPNCLHSDGIPERFFFKS